MKAGTKLARVFSTLAQTEQKTESTASEIFAIIKDGSVKTIKAWDALVRDAYETNGWNTRPGRPAAGAQARSDVPDTVRTYVSIVRAALRSKMRMPKYASFSALRTDLAKRRNGGSHGGRTTSNNSVIPKAARESFIGVSMQAVKEPNGALFHDLGAVYINLPPEHRDVFGRQLNKLLHKYLPLAKITAPRLPAPAANNGHGNGERKAA